MESLECRRVLAAGLGWEDALGSEPSARVPDSDLAAFLAGAGGNAELAEGEGRSELVSLRLATVNAAGEPISSIQAGQTFRLRSWVQDIRSGFADRGVFAAYMDVRYDSSRLAVVPDSENTLGFDIQFGPDFGNFRSGDVSNPGIIDEVGAFQLGSDPLGPAEFLLFDITMRAGGIEVNDDRFDSIDEDQPATVLDVLANDQGTTGSATLWGEGADVSPAHDVLLFRPPSAVDPSQIRFNSTAIDVLGGDLQISSVSQPDQGGQVEISLQKDRLIYTPAANFHGEETFTYTVNETATARVTIVVQPVNDPPRAVPDAYTTGVNQALNIGPATGVLANDQDVDGDALQAFVVAQPAMGSLQFNRDGSFEYLPDADFRGTDSFTYFANDGSLNSEVTRVEIVVGPPEVAYRMTVVNAQGQSVEAITAGDSFRLRGSIQDIRDQENLGIFAAYMDVSYDASQVFVEMNSQSPLGFEVTFHSEYENVQRGDASQPGLLDDLGAVSTSTLPNGGDEKLLFEVEFEAIAAIVEDDQYDGIAEDARDVVLAVLENDALTQGTASFQPDETHVSPEFDTLLYVPVKPVTGQDLRLQGVDLSIEPLPELLITSTTTPDQGGTVAISEEGQSLLYTPAPNFHGIERFTYTVGGNATATVEVRVDPQEDAPVAVADQYTVSENRTLSVPPERGLLANDSDADGDFLTAQLVTPPALGTLSLLEDGSFTYEPVFGDLGPHSFEYRASDGKGLSEVATVTLDFEPTPARTFLTLVDGAGQAISRRYTGQPLVLQAWVQDQRTEADQPGIFAAYLDVEFDSSLLDVVREPNHPLGFAVVIGPNYSSQHATGSANTGEIDELGTWQAGETPLGSHPQLLWEVELDVQLLQGQPDQYRVSAGSTANRLPVLENELAFEVSTQLKAGHADEQPDHAVRLFEPREPLTDLDVRTSDVAVNLGNARDLTLEAVTPGTNGGVVQIIDDGKAVDYRPAPGFVGTETFSYTVVDPEGHQAVVEVTVEVESSWQNLRDRLDVNSDSIVSPVDVLIVINEINQNGSHPLGPPPQGPPFLDVNADGEVSPLDALIVINFLNNRGSGEGEPLPAEAPRGQLSVSGLDAVFGQDAFDDERHGPASPRDADLEPDLGTLLELEALLEMIDDWLQDAMLADL